MIQLVSDEKGKPTQIRTGSQTFYLIKREDRFGIRLKDSNSKARLAFQRAALVSDRRKLQSHGPVRSFAGAEGSDGSECPGREV